MLGHLITQFCTSFCCTESNSAPCLLYQPDFLVSPSLSLILALQPDRLSMQILVSGLPDALTRAGGIPASHQPVSRSSLPIAPTFGVNSPFPHNAFSNSSSSSPPPSNPYRNIRKFKKGLSQFTDGRVLKRQKHLQNTPQWTCCPKIQMCLPLHPYLSLQPCMCVHTLYPSKIKPSLKHLLPFSHPSHFFLPLPPSYRYHCNFLEKYKQIRIDNLIPSPSLQKT